MRSQDYRENLNTGPWQKRNIQKRQGYNMPLDASEIKVLKEAIEEIKH